MTFRDAILNVLENYSHFRGRASRAEFGWWVLLAACALAVLFLVDQTVAAPLMGFRPFDRNAGHPLLVLGVLVVLTPTLAVATRRLHDAERSGAWLWAALVPALGWAWLAWLLSRPTSMRDNRYGSNVIGLSRT